MRAGGTLKGGKEQLEKKGQLQTATLRTTTININICIMNHAVNGSIWVERCVGCEVSWWIVHALTGPSRCAASVVDTCISK